MIYADPPWRYSQKTDRGYGADARYRTMPLREIEALDVRGIAADSSVCFLWATSPFLADALGVLEAWGFRYSTVAFVWVKKTSLGNDFVGLGSWTCPATELVLLGARGRSPERASRRERQLVEAPLGRHSAKPEEVRTRIDKMFVDVPRVELFARGGAVPGWTRTGLESDGLDVVDFLRRERDGL